MKIIFKYFILSLLFLSTSLYANEKKNVLILHSYNQSFKWTNDINIGINSVLKDKFSEIKLFTEYMDTKRYSSETFYKKLLETYTMKYKDIKFDLIISSDNNAFDFLKKYDKTLFKSAPVVFSGVNHVRKKDLIGYSNFTGINEETDIRENYKLIKKLHPNIKNIYTIIDSTTTGLRVKKEVEIILKEFSNDNINYQIIENITKDELKSKVSTLPEDSALLLSVFFRDKNNDSFEYYEISQMISEYSSSPLYALWDFNLEHGIVGGYLTSGLFQGKEAALMGKKILDGEKVSNIPIKYKSPNNYMFDFSEVLKHNIDSELLPSDSYILNKPSNFYEIYKKEIITLSIIFILMILMIIVLLINIQKRKKAEKRIQNELIFQQSLIDTVDTPIYYKNKEGIYIGCNKSFQEHMEKNRDEIIGKTIYSLLPFETAKFYNTKDNELLKSGNAQKFEGVHLSDGKVVKKLMFYKDVFYDEDKNIDGFVGVIFDITELKETTNKLNDLNKNLEEKVYKRTEALEDANDELEQTIFNLKQTQNKLVEVEKMASLGGLVAGVAHELNTPVGISLTAITHLSDISNKINNSYLSDDMSEEEFKDYLKTSNELSSSIYSNLKKTANLVRSFKQIATDQTSENKRKFNLKEYIYEILLSINNITKETNLIIDVDCSEDINIVSYPGVFSQVISNLIINSIVHAYEEEDKGKIVIGVVKNNTNIQIIYEDDGKGISKENISKIFEPFFTTNRTKGGTGLGLNVIYNLIVNNLKGSISCTSEENKGVKFIINIPL